MISEQAFKDSAIRLGVDVAAIKAVAQVESAGEGFLPAGEPKILFEPHIFWKELRKRGITPVVSDIAYPVWGTKPYGKVSAQHGRLQRASEINREAALSSASWGKFQIMGFNYKLAGFETLQDFINAMYKSEDEHLLAFTNFIINTYLDDELMHHDWKGFARGYNGALYWKNAYDKKLALAYQKFKGSL